MISDSPEPSAANEQESEAEFLAKLQRLAEDWRYSDEFIGNIVRSRWPRNYNTLGTDLD